jgi:phosphohistidine phosphatase
LDLFLLRHGDSGKRMSDPSLTVSGKQEIVMIARSIKTLKLKFDAIITSPLKRATQTADIVAKVLGLRKEKNKITIWNDLAPEGNRLRLFNRLRHQFKIESTILMIGHQPYLSNMIYEIISRGIMRKGTGGGDRRATTIILKKGGLAKVRITSLNPSINGELRWLLTPRILKSLVKKKVVTVQNQNQNALQHRKI